MQDIVRLESVEQQGFHFPSPRSSNALSNLARKDMATRIAAELRLPVEFSQSQSYQTIRSVHTWDTRVLDRPVPFTVFQITRATAGMRRKAAVVVQLKMMLPTVTITPLTKPDSDAGSNGNNSH